MPKVKGSAVYFYCHVCVSALLQRQVISCKDYPLFGIPVGFNTL